MFDEKIKALNERLENDIVHPTVIENKRVYTVEEIIDILGISKTTAYNLVNSGEFHCVKVGGHYRISKKSFDRWLDDLDGNNGDRQVCD